MAPCTLKHVEKAGAVTVSLYQVWEGGYSIVARCGRELERVSANYYPSAFTCWNDMVQRYRQQAEYQPTADEAEFMAQWQEARRDAIDMRAWASGR